jgi:predicted nucleic acid-binding protein
VRAVVDASVAGKWYFPELGHTSATTLLDERLEGRLDLLAPDLLESEFANLLWKKIRRNECDEDSARRMLEAWQIDRPEMIEGGLLSARALELALRLDHPVYDCLYIAASIEFEAALATADMRLAHIASAVAPDVRLIGEDPPA